MTKYTKRQTNFGMSLENMNEAVLFVEGKLIACCKVAKIKDFTRQTL